MAAKNFKHITKHSKTSFSLNDYDANCVSMERNRIIMKKQEGSDAREMLLWLLCVCVYIKIFIFYFFIVNQKNRKTKMILGQIRHKYNYNNNVIISTLKWKIINW